jgi:hypothetical protein
LRVPIWQRKVVQWFPAVARLDSVGAAVVLTLVFLAGYA